MDVLPLQPRLLPNFERECGRESRSEPREINIKNQINEYSPNKIVETELSLASVPAMAIGSSTEILVSIVENQAGFRRNSFLSINSNTSKNEIDLNKRSDMYLNVDEPKSPDFEFVKSPSTELTNPSDQSTTPLDNNDVTLNNNLEHGNNNVF